MKVYINKYKDHWISPYTIIDYIFFWKDWSKCSRKWTLTDTLDDDVNVTKGGKSRYVEHPDWVEKWADRLTPISRAIQWVWDKVDRKVDYVKIDYWDTWSMDHTLSYIILPMLKQLQATKHGSCLVDDEDVPDELKSTSAPPKENEWDTDDNTHKRWDWVLNEMIWAFEQLNDPDWEEQFVHGTPQYSKEEEVEIEGYGLCYQLKQNNPDYWVDYPGIRVYNDRIMNGTRLFGKYYQNLWD